jgi:thiol-disulfide isomerase/thioredoxin
MTAPIMRNLTAFAVAASCFASTAFADDELAAEGKAAPMFRLPVYNAKATGGLTAIGLDKYVGPDATDKDAKVVLLSFMASFCGPCKKEMPYLESLHEKYGAKGLRIVMVSIDTEDKGYAIINELIEKNKVQFPVLKDRFNLVARRWLGTQSPLPSVFLINTEGVVKMVHRGYNQEASELLDKEVAAAVGAPTATAGK